MWSSLVKYNLPWLRLWSKVENILKGSLDSIPSPSPSVKIQIMAKKFSLRCKGKPLLGIVNKPFCKLSLLTTPNNVLPAHLSCPIFEFSLKVTLKVKVMGSNPGYLLKSFFSNILCFWGSYKCSNWAFGTLMKLYEMYFIIFWQPTLTILTLSANKNSLDHLLSPYVVFEWP